MVALVLDGLVGFPAGLSPTCFHLSPSSFHLSRVPGWLVSHLLSFVSPVLFIPQTVYCYGVLNALKNGRLGAGWSGRVPGWLVSNLLSFVSQFFSFVSGSRLACLHFAFICLPSAFHLSPKLGACGRVPGWLVSHFLSFVSQFFSFVSQGGCLWSGSRLACLPLPFICLPILFIPQTVYC